MVDKEELKPSAHLHNARHDTIEHSGHQTETAHQSQRSALHGGILALLVIEDKHQSRQTKEVQQVDTDAQACEIGNEYEPAVAVRLVGMVLPLEHQPEYNGREEAAVGIHLTLDGTEPEGVRERIDECTGHGAGLHDDGLRQCGHLSTLPHQLAHQMAGAPEEEHDAGSTEQRAHRVHHLGHQGRVAHKLCEEIGRKHEERCPRGMTDLQLIACSDKLRAVPETGGRLNSAAVSECSNGKSHPPHYGIHRLEILHNMYYYSSFA